MTTQTPQATISVSKNDAGGVTVGLEFYTPDGRVGLDMTLEQASFFCYALHEACRDGLQLNGGSMGPIEGMRIEHSIDGEPDGDTLGTSEVRLS